MNGQLSIEEFASLPTTVDYISTYDDFYLAILKDEPDSYSGTIVSGEKVIGYTTTDQLRKLSETNIQADIYPVVLGLLDKTSLTASGILQIQQQTFLNLRGQGVLLGFVDTGIDYTKKDFIYEDDTSKIQFLWDQTISGAPPRDFYEGSEYTHAQLNQAINSENPFDIVPSKDNDGHGTFLASVAGGRSNDDYLGAAPDSDFVVVKLRKARPYYLEKYLIPKEQENAFESTDIILGIEYILRKAQELNRPVSIFLALGTNLGSHDGISVLEEYLSIIANRKGVVVCLAAGNESQAKHHTHATLLRNGDAKNIDLNVGENSSDIYISLWNNAPDKMSISLKSPTGELIGRTFPKPGTTISTKLILEKSRVIIEYLFAVDKSGSQGTTIKIIDPTPGIWTITVNGDIVIDGTFHIWLPITGFVSPEVAFLSPTPNYTIVVPATTVGVITCGAYNTQNISLYSDTSWGPSRLPIVLPDLVSPGVNVGGVYPNGPGVMSGTSVAAAITAGACALMLQWGIVEKNELALNTYRARAHLIRGCDRDATIEYPSLQWGYGRLNLLQSFNLMRET